MSQKTDMITEKGSTNLKPNSAEKDVCDFLSERSELKVSFEEPDDKRKRRYDRIPLARTTAGRIADTSDFPSGKSDSHGNFSKKTFIRYRDTVNDFVQSQDITDLEDVTPKEINRFNQVCQSRDYARTTRDVLLQALRVFFEWAESEWRAPRDEYRISEVIKRKSKDLAVSADERSRAGQGHKISSSCAEEILGHLSKHDYASRQMVEFILIYHVGMRQSALLSLDCKDVKPKEGIIAIRHRPEEAGVRLKKGEAGERDVNIASGVMRVVEDYIDAHRTEPNNDTDALLTSWAGRIDDSTLYRDIADLTRCGNCTDESGEPLTKQDAAKCPESIGPHDLRRTAITRMKDEGLTWDTISGRVNATVDILKNHYDSPTHAEGAERRRAEVLNAL